MMGYLPSLWRRMAPKLWRVAAAMVCTVTVAGAPAPASVDGWELVSAQGGQRYTARAQRLAPGHAWWVVSGVSPDCPSGDNRQEWGRRAIWVDSGDTAQLVDPAGVLMDEWAYPYETPGCGPQPSP